MSGWSGLVVCGGKSAFKCDQIEALDANWEFLEEEGCFPFVTSDEWNTVAYFTDEFIIIIIICNQFRSSLLYCWVYIVKT